MFIFVATALAGTLIGWPCQRLNWGWRNVWSTCSINSYVPNNAGSDAAAFIPTFFRQHSAGPLQPSMMLGADGVFVPKGALATPIAAGPQLLCTNAAATGSGATANMRNRCRRAIDAYGALVKTCIAVPSTGVRRSDNTANPLNSPDWYPLAGHIPHVSNVQGLTHNAQFCLSKVGEASPNNLNTPSNTCPGLLGWFTVVFNACGFSNAPGMTPLMMNSATTAPNTNTYFPLTLPGTGNVGTVGMAATVLNGATVNGNVGLGSAGYFCNQGGAAVTAPERWNVAGPTFRTSRCRKALDQFGRTATRCHMSSAAATGPMQAGGYSDPLRLLAVGPLANVNVNAPTTPLGMNMWVPACNN